MITEEVKKSGTTLRKTSFQGAEIPLPPRARAEAAAGKVVELMNAEGITLDEAMQRPEVEEAARNAPLDDTAAPAEPAPEATGVEGNDESVMTRRYLLSIANQKLHSYDSLSDESLMDLIAQPAFYDLPAISYEEFCKRRG